VQDATGVTRERPAHRLDTPVARAEHRDQVDPGREDSKRHQRAAKPRQRDAADVLYRRQLAEVARERPERHTLCRLFDLDRATPVLTG
jgi:hypothetical protein